MLAKLRSTLKQKANAKRAAVSQRFFKTNPGQYGHGDLFLGIRVPELRLIAKQYKQLPIQEIKTLLSSPIHEERFIAVVILVDQFKHIDPLVRRILFQLYLSHPGINNWDLVDVSAPHIVGAYLDGKNQQILKKLARSKNLWQKRIAIVSTLWNIRHKQSQPTFQIADILIKDPHDLIHKATGWMLREVGKYCGAHTLESYLATRAERMPRTMLRYAIEHFPETKRKQYLFPGSKKKH